jgi:hypothetical protein
MPATAFDASKYLTDLGGRDYLEVKWRLLWLRTEHPDAVIETELVKHTPGLALFRARVSVPGAGTATGWGSETATDFEDYIEKAETKALGRALAALGYGTQFCEDFDFSAERDRLRRRASPGAKAAPPLDRRPVVDAPVARPDHAPDADGPRLKVVRDRRAEPATSSQVKAIYSIGRDHHEAEGAIDQRCRERFGRPPAQLSKRQASEFIDLLRQSTRPAAAQAQPGTATTS